MAYKLLTEAEVRNIGGAGTATANLLCTYARAQALGCTANGVSLASNQIVYEGSVKKNAPTTCSYSITQGPYSDSASCDGSTSTSIYVTVSGVRSYTGWGYVYGDVGGWSSNDTWSGTATATYTYSGCPNGISVTWNVTQSGCGTSCERFDDCDSWESCRTYQGGSWVYGERYTNTCSCWSRGGYMEDGDGSVFWLGPGESTGCVVGEGEFYAMGRTCEGTEGSAYYECCC